MNGLLFLFIAFSIVKCFFSFVFFFLQTLRKSLEADESIRESIQAARKVWDTVTNTVIIPKAINLLKTL